MFCNRNSDVAKFISLLLNGVLQKFSLSFFVTKRSLKLYRRGPGFPICLKRKKEREKEKSSSYFKISNNPLFL